MSQRIWESHEIATLAVCYPRLGATATGAMLERSHSSITGLARRLRIPSVTRRLRESITKAAASSTVDAGFFNQLNPAVAYVLGFLWAGGGVKTKHRQVLRVAVDDERRDHLTQFLRLLKSRHQIQQYGQRLVVEIGNSFLVRRLLDSFGQPPGRWNPDPPLPTLPDDAICHFARGHLDRSGVQLGSLIRWTGTPTQTQQLCASIRRINAVGIPTTHRVGRGVHMAWTQSDEVERLTSWLASASPWAL